MVEEKPKILQHDNSIESRQIFSTSIEVFVHKEKGLL
jgi:hypothetical protein